MSIHNISKSLWIGRLIFGIVLVSQLGWRTTHAQTLQPETNMSMVGLNILVIEEFTPFVDYTPLRNRYPDANWVVCSSPDAATYSCTGDQYLPLDPANWDIVFVYDIYNHYDATLLTDLQNYIMAGGSLYVLVDGALLGGVDMGLDINPLLTAAGYPTVPTPLFIDNSKGNKTQVPSDQQTCGAPFQNYYATGSYINTADVPAGINYLEYLPGRVNLIFGLTAQGGMLGIGLEYYSGGGQYNGNGPTVEVLDYIYDRMMGELNADGKCKVIMVTKTANVTTANVGQTITYTYRVTNNTGGLTLSLVSASDNKLGSVTLGTTTLIPGAFTTGSLTHTVALPGSLTNTVVVTFTLQPTGTVVTGTDFAVVDIFIPVYLPIILNSK